RASRRSVPHRHPHRGARLLLQARAADLGRAPRPRRRLPVAPAVRSPRRVPRRPVPSGARAPRSRARPHPGHHLVRFGQEEGGPVWGEFVDRATNTSVGRVEVDLLVACDGIHSVVRRTLYPDEGPPRWNGITMWRALTVGEPFLSGRTMIMAGHFRRRMVIYPISKRHEDQGRALINWVAELKTADDQPMPRQ